MEAKKEIENKNRVHPNIIVQPFHDPNQPHPVQLITTTSYTTYDSNEDITISPPNHPDNVQTASNSYYPTLHPQDLTYPYPYQYTPETSHHVPIHHPNPNAPSVPPPYQE